MKTLLFLCLTILCVFVGSGIKAQDTQNATNDLSLGMPELNLLSSISAQVSLELTTTVAGEAVQSSISDSTARVKISSIVAGSQTRTLTAQVTSGAIPAGTTLKLKALDTNANFGGTRGNLVGSDVTLSTESGASIVTGIGSCYSGTGDDDGYQLKYTWGLDNPAATYGQIRASEGSAITVTLTLSAGT